jgi:hypothetical protein
MLTLQTCIEYDEQKWKLCGNLKVLGLLFGMQQGYTEYSSILWLRRVATINIIMYVKAGLSIIISLQEKWIFLWTISGSSRCTSLPSLNIKLGLKKIFVQAVEGEKQAYAYLRNKLSKLIKAKVKVEIFIILQIRGVMQDLYYSSNGRYWTGSIECSQVRVH